VAFFTSAFRRRLSSCIVGKKLQIKMHVKQDKKVLLFDSTYITMIALGICVIVSVRGGHKLYVILRRKI